jgi:predicted Zn-dependent peptidase
MKLSFSQSNRLPSALLLLSLLGSAPLVRAEIDRSIKPNPGSAPAASFPEYQEITLKNGLRIFLIQDDRRPMVTFRLIVKSGSALDGEKPGTAALVANLLNRGTKIRTAEAFAKEADFLGSKVEAAAGPDSISLIASSLNKYTSQLLDLMSDAARHPEFNREQLEKARKISLSALEAQKQQPEALISKMVAKVVYGGHPYGRLATPESVAAIQREDLTRFHALHFQPKNATLAIVGDVSRDAVIALVEKAFGSWENTQAATRATAPLPEIKGRSVHLVDRPGSVQSNIVVCRPGPRRNTPDLPEVLVLNSTLGGGFSGRLFQNLRETHGWTYGAYSAFDPRKEAGSFQASAETRNEVTAPSVTEILKEIDRICKEPAPEEELALQREYNIGNYLLSLEKSDRTAQRVQDIDLYGLPQDFYKTYARRMGSVSPQLMQATAQSHLDTENICIVVVGEAKEVKASLETFGPVTVYDTDLNVKK